MSYLKAVPKRIDCWLTDQQLEVWKQMLKANTIKGRDSIVKSNEAKQLKKLPKDSDESTKLNKHSGSFSIPNDFGWDKSWGGKY